MVKHTQTICRQIADKLFEFVWPFCGIGAYKVKQKLLTVKLNKKAHLIPIFNFQSHKYTINRIDRKKANKTNYFNNICKTINEHSNSTF